MSALAIILARAGSKGVPGKNAALIAGKPCIAWTIDHARNTPGVSRIVVSTDGDELLDIARANQCEALRRPANLADDRATIDDAARHAVNAVAPQGNASDPILILYANVPIRPADLCARALAMLHQTRCDSVQSYEPVGKYHPWWTARVDPDAGAVRPWEGDVLNHGVFRRQDLPPAFIPDGGVIALRRAALMLQVPDVQPGPHAFLGRDRRGVINPAGSVVDIDSPIDLVVARAMLEESAYHRDTEKIEIRHSMP